MSSIFIKILLIYFVLSLLSSNISAQTRMETIPADKINEETLNSDVTQPAYHNNFATIDDSINPITKDSVGINDDATPDNNINYLRLAIVTGASAAILGGIYYRWKTAWWNEGTTNFHIYYNYTYIDNVDKVGHLYGGILFTECFGVGLRWAGLNEESSLLYGGIISTLIYTGVELKDGFAPTWGFDPLDLGASVIGAFYPYTQAKIPFLKNFNFKWSYYPSNSIYYNNMNKQSRNNQFFNDDYEGQTFWLTANLKNLMPQKINSFLPDFLNLALGISVENLADPLNKHRVLILSPDIDITKLIQTDSGILKEILRLLNYIHLPLPAIRISPNFKAYAIYLKP